MISYRSKRESLRSTSPHTSLCVDLPYDCVFKEQNGVIFHLLELDHIQTEIERDRDKKNPWLGKMGQPCILMSGPIQAGMKPVMGSAK